MSKPSVVLISGCSSGIGRTLALQFHARGDTVVATARKLESLNELARSGVRTAQLDVCSADSIAGLQHDLQQQGIVVDVLINNAGYGQMGPLLDLDSATIRAQFETNVVGLIAVTRAVLPLMRASTQPRIVNLGSVSGILTTPFAGVYCASKAAVHALSEALRMELKPFGVDVITIQPGAIQSEFGHSAGGSLQQRSGDSLYAAAAAGIAARAGASQQHSTSTTDFAAQLIRAVMQPRPPAVVRIGTGSSALPLLARWLPSALREWVLARRFGLDRL